MLTLLGPTASGKTALAARLACELNGEVISADSRQVYRGMDIGTGKDLGDYVVNGIRVPVHLTDLADPGYEYNIFEYQHDFLAAYKNIVERKKLPVLCGGSGMYLEAVLRGYRLAKAVRDPDFVAGLQGKTDEELAGLLRSYKTLHNSTDLEDRPRMLKAIEVARAAEMSSQDTSATSGGPASQPFPAIASTIFGISLPRELTMQRITERLKTRLESGMIAEVETLLHGGITPERLMRYGLEYRYITLFLTGRLTYQQMFTELNIAIRQFAKRQMTWFRRMERQGIKIHWIDGSLSLEKKVAEIIREFTAP